MSDGTFSDIRTHKPYCFLQILSNVHVYELLNAPAESKVHMREKELKAMKNSASGMVSFNFLPWSC